MKAFLALLKLELSGWKSAFSLNTGKNTKNDKKLSRALVMVLMLVIVAGYLAFMEWNALDFLISVGAQDLLLKMVVALSMVMTLLMGVFQVMSSLYFSKDIAILSYLPADERVIYAARMAGQWIEEILISALMIVPCVGVYMYRLGFSLPLLLRCIAVTVLSPVLPLCVSALISWLLTQLSAFWRHRETVITALSTVFIVAYIAMSFFMGQAGGRASDQEGFATLISAIRPAVERLTDSVPPVKGTVKVRAAPTDRGTVRRTTARRAIATRTPAAREARSPRSRSRRSRPASSESARAAPASWTPAPPRTSTSPSTTSGLTASPPRSTRTTAPRSRR